MLSQRSQVAVTEQVPKPARQPSTVGLGMRGCAGRQYGAPVRLAAY
ncbi:hypothetical protein DSL72_005588 [Monilinia vaccinii-corymbosi]|uniref:Uncharacterized protein n=1 Tax=Monilinia vaccinii-corymbosi TaxID=61207 RepID=A0A8A3PFQ8_9HELO|nr:hypothetical protein DSL72_005588 [Monilinia vaccinii-corymbosi]